MASLYATLQDEAPLTVTGLLNSLGLEKYVVLFQAEEVTFDYFFICFISFNFLFCVNIMHHIFFLVPLHGIMNLCSL
jgi:hypothetical protein